MKYILIPFLLISMLLKEIDLSNKKNNSGLLKLLSFILITNIILF